MIKMFTKYAFPSLILLIVVIGFIRGINFLDPDFGWHLREGQLIMQNGIQRVDPFSYTMPSFPYIDHEWLSNVFMYVTHESLGTIGMSLIFAALFALSLFLAVPQKYKNFSIIPLLLACSTMIGAMGIRPQVETWTFFALLLKIIFDETLWKKFKYIIPLIFVVWVNLHGGFAVGIEILFVILVTKTINDRKLALVELKVFMLSLFASGLNPYGFNIWKEIWMTVSDTSLRFNIIEWAPSIYRLDISYIIFVALSLCLLMFYGRRFKLYETAIYFVTLLMAFSSLRNVPLWAIVAVYVLSKEFYYFNAQLSVHKNNIVRFNKIKSVLFLVFLILFLYTIYQRLMGTYTINAYPVKAVEFLQKQNIEGNIFSDYNQGGYLIWKLPQKKVFIDGRMPSWRRSGNYPGESNYAFDDYLKMLRHEKLFTAELKKYNIQYVLLPKIKPKKQTAVGKKIISFEKKFLRPSSEALLLSKDLTKIGLTKIYDDSQFIIYKR